jgi:hypothetical protein
VRFLREEHITALETRDKALEENKRLKKKCKDMGVDVGEISVEESNPKDATDAEKTDTHTRK